MGDTKISWTMGDDGTMGKTWNPIRGCSRVSEGCRHCYAERVAARFSGPGQPYEGLIRTITSPTKAESDSRYSGSFLEDVEVVARRWNGVVRMVPEHLADPLHWKKPRRVFVNSMSDLFHESLTNEQIAAVFGVMAAAPQHTFQVLTKRAERMRDWFRWIDEQREVDGDRWVTILREAISYFGGDHLSALARAADFDVPHPWPLPNVWLGVSVENQAAADERVPTLLETPAALRFLSCEPLLEAVDLRRRVGTRTSCKECGDDVSVDEDGCCTTCGLDALWYGVDWVIAGCESGPGARPCDVAWLRSLRDQCAAAGVPYFLKQANSRDWVPALEYPAEIAATGGYPAGPIRCGAGSKRKAGGVIELPYLDGVQHAAFPLAAPERGEQ